AYIFIDASGGTGGGIFRYMYGRFLDEAAEITGIRGFSELGEFFKQIGDHWQTVAARFNHGYEATDPGENLPEITLHLLEIAGMEQSAWEKLRTLVE
ncbi:MAG: DUF4872 domain-containing protein, partial [Anaerolineales bacterium]|nr:DUF4872 domain-containing protein [Anaerolineales bacterium]